MVAAIAVLSKMAGVHSCALLKVQFAEQHENSPAVTSDGLDQHPAACLAVSDIVADLGRDNVYLPVSSIDFFHFLAE